MNTFITSDTHWGHANIIKHCNRPWNTIEEMDEALIANWNNVVKRGDLVYHIGDFAMIPNQDDGTPRMRLYRKLRMRLNGKIILIRGNHDQMAQNIYKECFSEVHDLVERRINGYSVTFCHFPMLSWNRSHYNLENNDTKRCSIMIHGHTHGRLRRDNPFRVDAGVDVWGYKPVLFEDVVKNIEEMKQKLNWINVSGY